MKLTSSKAEQNSPNTGYEYLWQLLGPEIVCNAAYWWFKYLEKFPASKSSDVTLVYMMNHGFSPDTMKAADENDAAVFEKEYRDIIRDYYCRFVVRRIVSYAEMLMLSDISEVRLSGAFSEHSTKVAPREELIKPCESTQRKLDQAFQTVKHVLDPHRRDKSQWGSDMELHRDTLFLLYSEIKENRRQASRPTFDYQQEKGATYPNDQYYQMVSLLETYAEGLDILGRMESKTAEFLYKYIMESISYLGRSLLASLAGMCLPDIDGGYGTAPVTQDRSRIIQDVYHPDKVLEGAGFVEAISVYRFSIDSIPIMDRCQGYEWVNPQHARNPRLTESSLMKFYQNILDIVSYEFCRQGWTNHTCSE